MTKATQTIPNGYKQTEIGVIPEDWDVKKLGEFDLDISDGNYSSKYPKASEFKERGIPFIRANNIKNLRVIDNELRFISNKLHSELIKGHLKKDDILITTRGEIGQIAIVPDRHIGSNINAQVVRINAGEKFNKYYFAYFLIKSDTQESLLNMQTGSALKQLPVGKLKELKIIYPSLPEQTAIATVLSDTDALIEKLEKLIAKKKAIKQGAMQQLLTGKKRLPRFSGEWEMKKLGEVCYIRKGQLITESTRIDGNIPVIAGGKTPAYFHNKANRHGKTITISGSGASAGYVAFHKYPIFASDCSTIEESRSYSIEYIYFLLQSLQDTIYKMQTGGAQPHIHPNDLNPIIVSIPKPEEQTAIATVLSDMDTEIEKLENKLGKYRQIKTGMMQQLLTGKIRLLRK